MRGAETLEDKIPESTWALSQRIIAMAWPNILYAILDRGLGLVDMWLAGSLDQAAVGSIGLSQKIMILVLIITISFTAGAMPIMGQAFGSKDLGRVRHAANQTLKAMLFSSLIIALILYLIADPAFRALKASDSVRDYGVTYLQCLVFGLPLMFLNYTIVILFRSIGYVKTPLVILVFVQVVNVLVSYFLLHGIDGLIEPMGVRGLAIGTIAARGVGAFLGIAVWFYLIRHYPQAVILHWRRLPRLISYG